MKIVRFDKYLRIISSLTLLLFLSFFAISVITIHVHTLPNGNQIVHSHLSKDTEKGIPLSDSKHSHTENEYLTLSAFSLDKIKISFISFALIVAILLIMTLAFDQRKIIDLKNSNCISLRAPPII